MTDFAYHDTGVSTNPVARFFNWIWNGVIFLAESSSRAQAVRRLSEMSDEDLAALGTSRQEMARKIFADCYYV